MEFLPTSATVKSYWTVNPIIWNKFMIILQMFSHLKLGNIPLCFMEVTDNTNKYFRGRKQMLKHLFPSFLGKRRVIVCDKMLFGRMAGSKMPHPQRTSIKTSWLQLFVLNNLSLMLADHFKKFTTHPPRTPPAIHQNGSLVRKEGKQYCWFFHSHFKFFIQNFTFFLN